MILNIERVKRMDKLIQLKATGTPKELSIKIGISERGVFDNIKKMKKLGAPIEYCKINKSYIYTKPSNFQCYF
jgi:biotin operon repressor